MPDKRVLFETYDNTQQFAWIDDRSAQVRAWEHVEDSEPAKKYAGILAEDPPKGRGWVHAAAIPDKVFEKSLLEGWDRTDWARWANDPDNSKLRTWKGRVGS